MKISPSKTVYTDSNTGQQMREQDKIGTKLNIHAAMLLPTVAANSTHIRGKGVLAFVQTRWKKASFRSENKQENFSLPFRTQIKRFISQLSRWPRFVYPTKSKHLHRLTEQLSRSPRFRVVKESPDLRQHDILTSRAARTHTHTRTPLSVYYFRAVKCRAGARRVGTGKVLFKSFNRHRAPRTARFVCNWILFCHGKLHLFP